MGLQCNRWSGWWGYVSDILSILWIVPSLVGIMWVVKMHIIVPSPMYIPIYLLPRFSVSQACSVSPFWFLTLAKLIIVSESIYIHTSGQIFFHIKKSVIKYTAHSSVLWEDYPSPFSSGLPYKGSNHWLLTSTNMLCWYIRFMTKFFYFSLVGCKQHRKGHRYELREKHQYYR